MIKKINIKFPVTIVIFLILFVSLLFGCGKDDSENRTRLIQTAKSGNSAKIRQDACFQLGKLNGVEVINALTDFIELDDNILTPCAARSLGERREPLAVEPLLRQVIKKKWHDENMPDYLLVWALGEIGDLRAKETLVKLNKELDPKNNHQKKYKNILAESISKIETASKIKNKN